jgi:hypothetical protein
MNIDGTDLIKKDSAVVEFILASIQWQKRLNDFAQSLNDSDDTNIKRLMGREELFTVSLQHFDIPKKPKLVKEDKRPYYRKFSRKKY